MAWPLQTPCPDSRPSKSGVAVRWCSQPAMLTASSPPHNHALLTWGYPEGRCRTAAPCLAPPGLPLPPKFTRSRLSIVYLSGVARPLFPIVAGFEPADGEDVEMLEAASGCEALAMAKQGRLCRDEWVTNTGPVSRYCGVWVPGRAGSDTYRRHTVRLGPHCAKNLIYECPLVWADLHKPIISGHRAVPLSYASRQPSRWIRTGVLPCRLQGIPRDSATGYHADAIVLGSAD